LQDLRFRHLLRHAVDKSEFYRQLYRGIDVDHCRLADLPIVTKSVMMDNFDRFITDARIQLAEIQEWIADKDNYGKLSDFLYFQKPNGEYERFHPYRLRIPLFYATELRQYQIVQSARNELTFIYVLQNDGEGAEQHLRQILESAVAQAGLASRIDLKLKRVEEIPRDRQSGKYQIIVSLGALEKSVTEIDRRTY